MRRIIFGCGVVLASLASLAFGASRVVHAADVASQNYQVLAPVITTGGGYASSNNFSLLGVISAFSEALSSSESFNLASGFAAFPFVSTSVVSVTAGNASASLSWTAATGVLGYSVSSYSIGQSSVSGGPYSFTSVGNALSGSVSSLTNGTAYYFVVRAHDPYDMVIATSSEVSATPVAPSVPPVTSPSSGGSTGGSVGGSTGGIISTPTTILPTGTAKVNFSGRAYPRSTITFLKDAQVVASSVADANAEFEISLSNMSAGNFIFSVYSEDSTGNRSGLLSFPVSVTAGATTNIGGIFISPTIGVDKSQVKQGDTLTIFGQSSPKSSITITINSTAELFLQAKSDAIGAYLYNLDTSPLEMGSHSAKSKAAVSDEISDFGRTVSFSVGTQNVAKEAMKKSAVDDLNGDGRVNLVDFSIEVYWFHRPLTGSGLKADLNHDGKVDLVDLSILASHWTG